MSTRTYGILAGVIGSALGAWWYARRQTISTAPAAARGVTIFHNTPTPTSISEEGIV